MGRLRSRIINLKTEKRVSNLKTRIKEKRENASKNNDQRRSKSKKNFLK